MPLTKHAKGALLRSKGVLTRPRREFDPEADPQPIGSKEEEMALEENARGLLSNITPFNP